MTNKPIKLHNISLQFQHKTCFEDFSTEIPCGSRIGIIGRNGSGKSTFLKAIAGRSEISEGYIGVPPEVDIGYVEQIPEGFEGLSGAQRFNASLSKALSSNPDLLLLDEPTNHLDAANRKSLLRSLQNYRGTLIVASHDTALLGSCFDILWHINEGKINVIAASYDDYMHEQKVQYNSLKKELSNLKHLKKESHLALMQEQERAKKSKAKGENKIREKTLMKIISNGYASSAERVRISIRECLTYICLKL
jgi:ATPase subunit of ABC transporter with duplicated ATPase domains